MCTSSLSSSSLESGGTLVLIGLSFKPILSGERSSAEMHDGLSGLLGLPFGWYGLYRPYAMRKYSIGINIACGCSSVTNDPHAWTCKNIVRCEAKFSFREESRLVEFFSMKNLWLLLLKQRRESCEADKHLRYHTSTKAQYLRSSFAVMWRASVWKGDWSPTKISVRHFNVFRPSVMSGLLMINTWKFRYYVVKRNDSLGNTDYYCMSCCNTQTDLFIRITYLLLGETAKHLCPASHPVTATKNNKFKLKKPNTAEQIDLVTSCQSRKLHPFL